MTIVIFCPNILRDYYKDLFSLEQLLKDGYKVIFLDATKFYGHISTVTEKIILENRVECETRDDFINFKENLPQEPVLFIGFDFYNTFAAPIFQILIRERDYLLSFFTKRFASIDNKNSFQSSVLKKIVRIMDKFLPLHNFKDSVGKRYNTYIPDYYLCSTDYLIPNKVYFTIKKSNRITVHADDINKTINNSQTVIKENIKYAVFLDQGIPFLNRTHPKVNKRKIPEDYLIEYYAKVEKHLEKIKNKFNLDKMVIALHPDAVKFEKELNGKFSGFETYIGVTHELERDAKLVIGHCSTALSYAVYYNKPVIILKDDFLMSYNKRIPRAINFFTDTLGMHGVNMDDNKSLEK